ncbi:MAG TPA: aerotolerance regulator BatA [Chitinophagaceae bacterium]|nr:aerotolerance regulator BatA [Chitinophagaceae bacterium]HRF26466.1 VWA domain-containing protein [Ferruginibacter sp.]
MLFKYFSDISFAYPWVLALFLVLPLMIYLEWKRKRTRQASIVLSAIPSGTWKNWKSAFGFIPFVLRLLAISGIILAMARPQEKNVTQDAEGEGIDIMLCLDVSGSMTAQDFTPNRMEASKKVAIEFVQKRSTDRIGVVIFSGESFTQCPLTTDHAMVINAIRNIRNGLLEDGTAIGSGLATGVDRLRNSQSASKVLLLLTDGENNGGLIDPKTAKEIAKTYGVRVYTIGVGSEGYARQPVQTPFGIVVQQEKVSIDEKLLTEIATETGGQYFRARDNRALDQIYASIDQMEKSKVEIRQTVRYKERFLPFALIALFSLLFEWILRFTLFRKFP